MRTSLFLSSLFAISLVGGVALADGSRGHSDPGRAHGDQLDKSYSTPVSHAVHSSSVRTAAPAPYGSNSKSPGTQKETDRINCAPDSDACGHSNHAPRARAEGQSTPASGAASANKNPMHQRESQRVNCSDGDDCTAASKGAKALGSKGTSANTGSSTAVQKNATANRKDAQASAPRMSCNEGDDCSMSSKDAQKFWRAEAFKAGTASSSKDLAIQDFQRAEKQKMVHEKYEKQSDKPAAERNRDAAHNPTPDHE